MFPRLVLTTLLCAWAALPARSDTTKFAGRLFLSNGDVVEVVSTRTGNAAGSTNTLAARFSSGDVMTVSSKSDHLLQRSETRISDGRTTLEIFNEWGFYGDHLPVPLIVKIGDSIYRMLIKSPAVSDEEKRMRAAVLKLPSSFVAGLKSLVPVATSTRIQLSIEDFVYVESWCGERSGVTIVDAKALDPAERDALLRDAALGRRVLKSD